MGHQSTCERCKVYEAEISHHPSWTFSIAVNPEAELKLREDIWMGRKLITLGKLIAETDCARARSIADMVYA